MFRDTDSSFLLGYLPKYVSFPPSLFRDLLIDIILSFFGKLRHVTDLSLRKLNLCVVFLGVHVFLKYCILAPFFPLQVKRDDLEKLSSHLLGAAPLLCPQHLEQCWQQEAQAHGSGRGRPGCVQHLGLWKPPLAGEGVKDGTACHPGME